jgi:hypothetical protein
MRSESSSEEGRDEEGGERREPNGGGGRRRKREGEAGRFRWEGKFLILFNKTVRTCMSVCSPSMVAE